MTDTSDPFKQFEGISEGKNIQRRGESNLERLINIEKRLLAQNPLPAGYWEILKDLNLFYFKIYTLVCEETRDINFTENDLEDFVYFKMSSEHDFTSSDGKRGSILTGLYSGCLLQHLTERNEDKGKGTRIHIDGSKAAAKEFPFLFCGAKVVDELILENISGTHIGVGIGSYGGRVNLLVGELLEGYYVFNSVASYNGKAGRIIAINIKSECGLMSIGSNCDNRDGYSVKQLICCNVQGSQALNFIGSFSSRIEQVIGVDIVGSGAMFGLGNSSGMIGLIEQIIAIGIKSRYASIVKDHFNNPSRVLQFILADSDECDNLFPLIKQIETTGIITPMRINQFTGINLKGDWVMSFSKRHCIDEAIGIDIDNYRESNYGKSDPQNKLGRLFSRNNPCIVRFLGRDYPPVIIKGKKAEKEYASLFEKYNTLKLLELARSLRGKHYTDVLSIGAKLYDSRPHMANLGNHYTDAATDYFRTMSKGNIFKKLGKRLLQEVAYRWDMYRR